MEVADGYFIPINRVVTILITGDGAHLVPQLFQSAHLRLEVFGFFSQNVFVWQKKLRKRSPAFLFVFGIENIPILEIAATATIILMESNLTNPNPKNGVVK